MNTPIEWHLWSVETIADALPELVSLVESHLDELPEEHLEKNRAAVLALRTDPPTPTLIKDAARSFDLGTLGFALDVLGRRRDRKSVV